MNTKTDIFGLTYYDKKQMKLVFQSFPEIEKVILFGSRAMKTFQKGSDIDIILFYESDNDIALSVRFKLEEETNIPYFFDVIDYKNISSEELKEHIHNFGVIIYEKSFLL